jgi:hypothetical protein
LRAVSLMSVDAGSDVAWVATCNDIIFLDIGEDRYFRLEEPANADALARIAADGSKFWAQPQCLPRPAGWKPAATSAFPLREAKFSLSGIAAAMWLERRLAARLSRTGLKRTLASVRTLLDSTQSDKAHIAQAPLIANDFHQAHLLRSAAEQCLRTTFIRSPSPVRECPPLSANRSLSGVFRFQRGSGCEGVSTVCQRATLSDRLCLPTYDIGSPKQDPIASSVKLSAFTDTSFGNCWLRGSSRDTGSLICLQSSALSKPAVTIQAM